MARGIFGAINTMARAAERASREQARERSRLVKENERHARLEEQLGKQDYLQLRIAETEKANAQLAERLEHLRTILSLALDRDPSINFEKFLKYPKESDLDSDQTLRLFPKPERESFLPKKPAFFAQLIPGANKRFRASVVAAEQCFSEELEGFEEIHRRRRNAMAILYASAEEHNQSVKAAEAAFTNNDPEAIRNYFELVLSMSEYPGKFPRKVRVAFVPESKQLVFDYQLPTIQEIIPLVEKYKYVKATKTKSEIKNSDRTRQTLYAKVIAQTALRCVYEVFAADKLKQIDVVALNGYVDTVDSSTGRTVQPCIISVRTTRDEFGALDLRKVEPISCLKRLSASISRSPSELIAVKPIVDINMVDPRFIQEQDILSTLDNRLNLMELSPGSLNL
jgi:restriction system protein